MTFNDVKNWFWHSETILIARIESIGGFFGAAIVVAFSSYDMTQLASMDSKSIFKMLLALAVSGILTEYARRRNTTTVTTVAPSVDSAAPVVTKMLSPTPPPGP